MPVSEHDDERCPRSDDGEHCVHWWDGDSCHACGAPEMSMAQKVEQGMVEGPVRDA